MPERKAYPLLSFAIGQSPDSPTIAVFELKTVEGSHLFAATRQMLEDMARDIQDVASLMPRKTDQH